MKMPVPELSRPVDLDDLTVKDPELDMVVTATEAECAALAERFGLPAILSLKADITVASRQAGHLIEVSGEITGTVQQYDVVTNEVIESPVREVFLTEFSKNPSESDLTENGDAPEALQGNSLDVGEVIAQYFFLGLDPYPKKENADKAAPPEAEAQKSPLYEALKALRSGQDKKGN